MKFSRQVLAWFDRHGRRDLPWQVADPYAVWVSEIMLQQTQVAKVLDYYARFMARFPTLESLALADESEVLALWSGLGYYNRARFMHKAARICLAQHAGRLPSSLDALLALPGIGRSTAGAILSLTGQQRQPILDGNVKRLFARHFLVTGDIGQAATIKQLWALAEQHLPPDRHGDYNQALMDLGASICTRGKPACDRCPVRATCQALKTGQVSELPQKKRKVASPRVELHVALVLTATSAGRQIWLQQRDGTGIWPSLWFVPVFASANQLMRWWCDSGLPPGYRLPTITHVLTHRRLSLRAHCVQLDTGQRQVAEPTADGGRWVRQDDLPRFAHPRALDKLLQIVDDGP